MFLRAFQHPRCSSSLPRTREPLNPKAACRQHATSCTHSHEADLVHPEVATDDGSPQLGAGSGAMARRTDTMARRTGQSESIQLGCSRPPFEPRRRRQRILDGCGERVSKTRLRIPELAGGKGIEKDSPTKSAAYRSCRITNTLGSNLLNLPFSKSPRREVSGFGLETSSRIWSAKRARPSLSRCVKGSSMTIALHRNTPRCRATSAIAKERAIAALRHWPPLSCANDLSWKTLYVSRGAVPGSRLDFGCNSLTNADFKIRSVSTSIDSENRWRPPLRALR
eukprot:scaffold2671_cov252-Pinguiococcus_pyrenoidosus.AAC.21